ncbi:MAG: DUF4349 domain-containing protein, partial [Actinomycetota bacterium]
MKTEFEFLRRFETELTMRAKADARREASPSPKYPRRWKPWVAAAAALLVLAGVIGLLAGGYTGTEASRFSSVGSAVGGVDRPLATAAPPADQGTGQMLGVVAGSLQQRQAKGVAPEASAQAQPGGGANGGGADLSKIIRDGQIAVTIDAGTFKTKAGSVAHIAAVNGGSILSSSTEGGDSGSFTIRVPAANFDKAMVQLAQLGTVDSSASQGQDVTAQYVDLKAHMKIYVSRRRVLFGLMNKATTIGQSLTLQNQLDQVQLKIDQITGQINYINKQVAESTIKVDLHEPGAAAAQSPDAVDNPSLGHAW